MSIICPVLAEDLYYCDNVSEWIYSNCEGFQWIVDQSGGYPSAPSLRSEVIKDLGVSSICGNVTGPKSISFWWRIDFMSKKIARLDFLIDDEIINSCSSLEWASFNYTIADNKTHTLTWRFRKFRSYPEYAGVGWIDEVCINSPTHQKSSERTPNNQLNMSIDLFELNMYQKNNSARLDEICSEQKNISHNIYVLKSLLNDIVSTNKTVYVKKYYVDPSNYTFSSINEAILHVRPSGTVKVDSGEYNEQIHIEKPLSLIAINRNKTIIQFSRTVIYSNSSNVIIDGFTIDGMDKGIYGILAKSSANCSFDNNNIINCAEGLTLYKSNDSSVLDNHIFNINTGIHIENSSNNRIINNNISDSRDFGVCLKHSLNNIIKENVINVAEDGIHLMEGCMNDQFDMSKMVSVRSCEIYIDKESDYKNNTFDFEYEISSKNGGICLTSVNPLRV